MRKYLIPIRDAANVEWRADIENDAYMGAWVMVKGVSEASMTLEYEGSVDDPFTTLIPSKLTISVYNQGQIDANELQLAQDRQWKVKLYKIVNGTNVLYWSGFLIADNIQYPLLGTPYQITLSAICGLTMLDQMPYVHADLEGGRVPMNYFRQILFNNLGIALPIRWTNSLQCTAFIGEDVFTGGPQWAVNNDGFYSYQSGSEGNDAGPIRSNRYILEGLLKCFQCRIFQANGRWTIRRINDFISGSFNYRQIPDTLGALIVTSGYQNVLNQHGRNGYPFINEDQIITSKPGIKTARVEYNANVRNNILPNGNQDVIDGTDLRDWGSYSTYPFVEVVDGLDGRAGGHAAKLDNFDHADSYYTLKTDGGTLREDGLPIDTQTMVKTINFGFMFSLDSGFAVDGDGFIIWDSNPFQIQVIFNVDEVQYYLNNFGFWQTDPIYINITVDGLKLDDIARVDFNKFQNVIMPTPDSQPTAGSVSDIVVLFVVKQNQSYKVDNIYINIDKGNDVYESTLSSSKNTSVEEVSLDISSSFGGYQLSNLMTSWSKSDTECFYREGLTNSATLTQLTARSIMKFRYKSSKIYNGSMNVRNGNWSFDEMYLIDSFGSSKFMPMPGTKFNIEKSEVFLIAIEARSDNSIIFTEKYYNSNDQPLSN